MPHVPIRVAWPTAPHRRWPSFNAAGIISRVFDLDGVRYISGAPMAWRRWLTPGTPVVLRFEEAGVSICTASERVALRWDQIDRLDVRGPTQPESRTDSPLRRTGFELLLGRQHGPKERFSWLAVRLPGDVEVIFEVDNLLRQDLERLLEEHSG